MIILYRIYQVVVMMPVLLVATFLAALITIIGCFMGLHRTWGYYPAHFWARLFCIMTFVRVKVIGRENIDPETSYVFVANHQGAYDIFAIYGYLNHNFKWMMKKSLEKIPFVGYACKKSGHIMVDKSSPIGIQQTMMAAKNRLKNGMSLVVFPEGSRSKTGKMARFKKGAFALATEFGLPIVPITIDGAYDIMPRSAKLPRPGSIRVTIHQPLAVEGKDMTELMAASFDAISSALPDKYK